MKKRILKILGLQNISEDLQSLAIISEIRNKKHFIQSFVNDGSVIRLEKESPEQYFERCYLAAFENHIKDERAIVKNMLEISHPTKSVTEIKRMLEVFY